MDGYDSRLNELQEQIEAAQRRLYELEGAQKALAPQRQTILELCAKHGIAPHREAVATAIAEQEQLLSQEIRELEQALKEIHS